MLWGLRTSTHLTATREKRQSKPNRVALPSISWGGIYLQGWTSRLAGLGPKALQLRVWNGRALLTLPGIFLTSDGTRDRSIVKPNGGRELTRVEALGREGMCSRDRMEQLWGPPCPPHPFALASCHFCSWPSCLLGHMGPKLYSLLHSCRLLCSG